MLTFAFKHQNLGKYHIDSPYLCRQEYTVSVQNGLRVTTLIQCISYCTQARRRTRIVPIRQQPGVHIACQTGVIAAVHLPTCPPVVDDQPPRRRFLPVKDAALWMPHTTRRYRIAIEEFMLDWHEWWPQFLTHTRHTLRNTATEIVPERNRTLMFSPLASLQALLGMTSMYIQRSSVWVD